MRARGTRECICVYYHRNVPLKAPSAERFVTNVLHHANHGRLSSDVRHAFSVGPLLRSGFDSRILGENTLTICTMAVASHVRLVLVMAIFQNVDLQLHGP